MALRQCTVCGMESDAGIGKATFVCDACLRSNSLDLETVMRRFTDAAGMIGFLSMSTRVPTIALRELEIAEEVLGLLPRTLCKERVVIPVSQVARRLIVAVTDPRDEELLEALRIASGLVIDPVIASADDIRAAHTRYWSGSA